VEEKMEEKREKINQAIADMLEIPRDLVLDIPRLTVIGQQELYLENHKGIIEYDLQRIRISLARGFLEVEGEGLEIKAIVPDEMIIYGQIRVIRYHE
jgi:sporulation protein YqfC